jgi:hypothetical protein
LKRFLENAAGYLTSQRKRYTALEESLNEFFHLHRKDRGVRVFVFMRDDGIWFLIRHGLPMKREAAITDQGESKGVLFRPEIYDVLTFYRITESYKFTHRRLVRKKPIVNSSELMY